MLVFYWPKKQNQWIVGTELQSPVYPTRKIGLEYPSLSNWNHRSSFRGVSMYWTALNLISTFCNQLIPQTHTTGPLATTSHQTYCSAWKLRIRKTVCTITVLVPESEVNANSSFFFEGAAISCDEYSCQVGHSFVEQMGYTQ